MARSDDGAWCVGHLAPSRAVISGPGFYGTPALLLAPSGASLQLPPPLGLHIRRLCHSKRRIERRLSDRAGLGSFPHLAHMG